MWGTEKTEAPTPRRREEARRQGLVPRSSELTGSLVLLAAALGLGMFLPAWWKALGQGMQALFLQGSVGPLLREGLGKPLAFLAALAALAFLAGAFQTRFLFTAYPLRLDWQRVNPSQGLRRIFSLMTLWELTRQALKALIIGFIGFSTLRAAQEAILEAGSMGLGEGLEALGQVGGRLAGRILMALLALAILDYLLQWWRVERSLRMTRQEVKEEWKHTEGDPQVKARLRQRHRQWVLHRQVHQVRRATVVVTNPIHVAVALAYRPQEHPAPQVVAKGSDWMAQRILQEAQRYRVPVVAHPPLAQALMKVPIGAFLPPALYQAAAEVLAQVFRATGRAREILGEA